MTEPQLTYYPLGEGVTAFSTTRHGGFSRGNYGEFNVNRYCGDAPEAIRQNRRLLSLKLGVTDDRIVMSHQVHGVQIRKITLGFLYASVDEQTARLEGVDALMTNVHGVCIGVSTADCIPIIIYDPQHEAVCAVHAGWRGTVQRIAREAMLAMITEYGSNPSQLQVVIGPGISMEAFEVGGTSTSGPATASSYRLLACCQSIFMSLASVLGNRVTIISLPVASASSQAGS